MLRCDAGDGRRGGRQPRRVAARAPRQPVRQSATLVLLPVDTSIPCTAIASRATVGPLAFAACCLQGGDAANVQFRRHNACGIRTQLRWHAGRCVDTRCVHLQMIFHVWRTNATLLQKMAQEIVRRALVTGPPPRNLAGLKLVLHTAEPSKSPQRCRLWSLSWC